MLSWPGPSGWTASAGLAALTLSVMGLLGFSSGLYVLHPAHTVGLGGRLLETLIAPAIGEEVFFRGLLLPGRDERARFVPALIAATAVFTLWHVVEAATFLPAAAPMFLRADFLTCAAVLGLGCGVMRRLSGSIWPGVATHWIMVTLWQTWLGGFTL